MPKNRLVDYKEKLKILRQIHSDKAKKYDVFDLVLNYGTLIATVVITSLGFLGFENVKTICALLDIDLVKNTYEAFFNLVVLVLLVVSVLNVSLDFKKKSLLHWSAITNITKLLVFVDDLLVTDKATVNPAILSNIRQRYESLIDTLPPNTDREFFRAKQNLIDKKNVVKKLEEN